MSRSTLSIAIWIQACILFLNLVPANTLAGDTRGKRATDTIPKIFPLTLKESVRLPDKDSLRLPLKDSLRLPSVDSIKSKARSAIKQSGVPDLFHSRPIFKHDGGFVNYSFLYRANIDTPYLEKDIVQHTVNGNANVTIAGIPVRLGWLVRKSNSDYFRDIYDVRAEFNSAAFRSGLLSGFRQQIFQTLDHYKDSAVDKVYFSKLSELEHLNREIENPFTQQKLVEMNEIIRIPALTYDASLPDSIAKQRSDSVRLVAKEFMDMYQKKKQQQEKLRATVDSLQGKYYSTAKQINQLKSVINGQHLDWQSLKQLRSTIQEVTGKQVAIPEKYQWLMGVRSMGLGRNQLNYSELTAKNISVNGINFEYNSWYYFAVSAGLVDYRFRDFSLKAQKKTPQYLYMVRAGLGQLEKNYFILSFFRGQKQLYPTYNTDRGVQPITVTGLSAEAKWQVNRNSYIITEVAQSSSPGLSQNPTVENKFWDLSDNTNKALSVKVYSSIPQTNSRIEGGYKFTGANYQSFTSFQTNAANTSWFVKAEQGFLKRTLRISAALRSNEFSNPFIVQNYKSNTIFKSVQAVFRKRYWPTVSVGFIPASQIVKLDNQLLESRFQTLNASFSHIYKAGLIRAGTTVVFNKFYNTSVDSGFVYFNALNFIVSQNFFFTRFNATLNVMSTVNSNYRLHVLDASVQLPLGDVVISAGGKVNNLNNQTLKIGYGGSAQVKLFRQDILSIGYEKGYLTGAGNNLVRNDFLNIGFSKFF